LFACCIFILPGIIQGQTRTFGLFTESEANKSEGDFFADFADQAIVDGDDLNATTFDAENTEQVFDGTKSLKIVWDGESDEARVKIGIRDGGSVDLFKISYGILKFHVYLTDTMDFRLMFETNKNNEGKGTAEAYVDDDLGVMDMNKTGEWQEVEIDLSQEFDGDMLTFEEFEFIAFRNRERIVTTMYIDNMYIEMPEADIEAPQMSRGYPTTTEVKPQRARLAVWPNEACYVYAIVKSSTDAAPTVEEVLATTPVFYGRNMDEALQFEVIGLEANAEQTAYIVLKDRMHNTSDLITSNFTTIPNATANYNIYKAVAPIAITTEIDSQWADVASLSINDAAYGGDKIADENDLSGSAKFLWDSENLYALLEVSDANIYSEPEGDPISEVYGMYTETAEHKTGGYIWDDPDITGVEAWKEEGSTSDTKADGTVTVDSSFVELDNTDIPAQEGSSCIKFYQHGNKNGRIGLKWDNTSSLRKLNDGKLVFYVYLTKRIRLHLGFGSTKSNGFRYDRNELEDLGVLDLDKINEWQRVEIDLTGTDYDEGKIAFEEFEALYFETKKWANADDWEHRGVFYVDDIHFEYSYPMNVDNVGFYLDVNDSKHSASVTARELPNNESVEIAMNFGNDTVISGDNLKYTPEVASFTNEAKDKYYVQAAFNWGSLGFDYQPPIGHDKRIGLNVRIEDNDLGNIAESMISAFNASAGKYDCSQWGNAALLDQLVSVDLLKMDSGIGYLNIYPNPTSSFLHVEAEFKKLEIFNIEGKLIYQSNDNSVKILNVSNFKDGIYIISVRDMNNSKLVNKFVKR
jgi:hypothetical protein